MHTLPGCSPVFFPLKHPLVLSMLGSLFLISHVLAQATPIRSYPVFSLNTYYVRGPLQALAYKMGLVCAMRPVVKRGAQTSEH